MLTAEKLVEWKQQHGALKVPVVPKRVIICPQASIVRAKQNFLSKKIEGLSGMHICADAKSGTYISGGWGVGAPAMVAVCEELRVLGAKEFYLAGVCGRLTDAIHEGALVAALSAIREEGTSQHYTDANTHIANCPDADGLQSLAASLGAMPAKFVSTDAPYRETPDKCNEWRKAGASTVDMETSALYTFGSYYGIKTYSFAVAADLLLNGEWTMAGNYKQVEGQLSATIDKLVDILKQ